MSSSVTEREIINALIERVEILEDKVRYLENTIEDNLELKKGNDWD